MIRNIHILVIGRPNLLRDGICALLKAERGISVVGVAASLTDAITANTLTPPDLALVDFSVGYADLEDLPAVRQRWPRLPIVATTFGREWPQMAPAAHEHAHFHVLQNEDRAELISLIRGVAATNIPSIAVSPIAEMLTEREIQVMTLIAAGYRTREIALRLSLSHKTIEKYRSNLMRKLGLRSATAVTAYAIAHGYWSP